MIISGIITNGLGVATQTFFKQYPLFKKLGLKNIGQIHNGTINIDISPKKFSISSLDYLYKDVKWQNEGTEDFGFIEVQEVRYQGKKYFPGYIYIPHNSPHSSNSSQLELICLTIPGIKSGTAIELMLNDGKIEITN